jgi:hypothetical protein
MVQKTKDYGIFKISPNNRAIDQNHVKRLTYLIAKKNLLIDRPILVDNQFTIIDGQHRYYAAINCGVDIYYMVSEVASSDEASSLNAGSHNWGIDDYANYYAKSGNVEYIKLLTIKQKYNLKSVNTFLKIVNTYTNEAAQNNDLLVRGHTGHTNNIKHGTFKMKDIYLERLEKYLVYANILKPYVKEGDVFRTQMIIAVHQLIKDDRFKINDMIDKAKSCANPYQWKTSRDLIYKIYDDYNYKRRNESKISPLYH